MAVIELDLPEEVVERLLALPIADRSRFMTVAFLHEWEDREISPLMQEDLNAIGEGFAEADAGLGRDGSLFLAELRERYNVR